MNKKQIEKLIYSGSDKDYSLGNGLYIRVRKSSKVWIYRGTISGKPRVKTIGKFPDIATDEARKAALQLRHDFKSLNNGDTVKAFLHKYYTEAVLGSKNKRGAPHKRPLMAKRYLDQIEEQLGLKKMDSVTRKELISFIADYSKRGARVADVLRGQLKSVFDYAVFHGVVKNNPMLQIDSRVTGYRAVSRERVLTDQEIILIFNSTHRNARLLRFLLLTGLRISEAQSGYKDGDFWRLDAGTTKNNKAHWVCI